jgi:hypothetical protein
MTARGTWKASERRIAEILGGKRVPVTGRERGSAPDVEHPFFAIEHKYGKVLSTRFQTAIEQANAAAEGTDKLPLVTFEHARGGNVGNIIGVTMLMDDFLKLILTLEEDN